MKHFMKRCFSMALAFTVAGTMLPVSAANAAEAAAQADSAEQKVLRAAYVFEEDDLTDREIADTSGNNFHAQLKGNGASIAEGMLTLPGGGADSKAAYVEIPKEVFAGQNTLTIQVWLKNQTGSNNYSAMYFGTKTKHVDSASTASMPLNYWILNPAQPDGFFKSVWTDSDNTSEPFKTETAVSTTKTSSDWALYTTVITPGSIKGYYNGVEVSSSTKKKTTTDFGTDLVAYIGRSSYHDMFYKGGVYGVTVYAEELTQEEIQQEYVRDMPAEFAAAVMEKVKETITKSLGDISEVSGNLTLPTEGENGAEISWSSSKPDIIANDGTVRRPDSQDADVTLTAVIKIGQKTETLNFQVKVISSGKQSQLNLLVKRLAIEGQIISENIELPAKMDDHTAISWSSSNPDVVKIEHKENKIIGTVMRPDKGAKSADVTLKASVVYDDGTDKLSAEKDFTVKVLAQDYGFLMAYTNSSEAESLGKSLHLAYSQDGLNYKALNSSTGICFADNTGGSKNSNPNRLEDMYIFRKPDGTYGMIARNSTNQKYVYVFDSNDLVYFTNERKLALDTVVSGNLEVSQHSYDGTNVTYAVYWRSGDKNYQALTRDFVTVIEQGETEYSAARDYTTDIIPPQGAVITDILGVSKSEYEYVVNKLDIVKNTGIQPVNLTVDSNSTSNISDLLPATVTADYSDGSAADFGVVWNAQDMSKVDLSKTGTYTVSGTVQQKPQYANPFIEQRADPCILKGNDGYYYFTASYPVRGNNDPEGYDRIVLRRSKTIEGLAQAEETAVWHYKDTDDEFRYIWAPEIRLVDDNYYIFYTSSVESGSPWGIRPHVLKCTNPEDIMNKESWQAMGKMQSVESDGIAFTGFSLDMTVFENKGHWYVIWAQTDGFSSLFLAEINPKEPWKCISESVKISVPEYSWERQVENVDEGPSVIKNNGKIYVAFSASGTGPEYCVGLLSIDENADMLDKNAWVKQPYPVLTSSDVQGEYGPGHNSFTVDEEGNPIFVYHARGEACYNNQCQWADSSSLNDPCRDARLKRVHWAADGTPILKMSYEEELAKKNYTVTAVVTVETPSAGVTLNKTSLELKVGESETLTATVMPPDTTNKTLKWESKNPGTATVENGKVTAVAAGTTEITATTANGKTAVCQVTVSAAGGNVVRVTKVTLNKKKLTLGKGETFTLKAVVAPKNATNKKVTFISSKPGVVSVGKTNGKLKAKKTGKAVITAAVDGKTVKCNVTVKKAPSKIQKLNKTKVTLKKGKTFKIKATLPKNTASNTMKYKSSNKKVATVDVNGKIKAKKKGKATITVTTFNKKKKTIKVTVK